MSGKHTNKPKTTVTDKVETSDYDIFTLVTKNDIVMIAVADKIVSRQTFKSEEEAQAYIESKPWELLINVSCICFEMVQKQKEQKH